jgi:hypothetical protein
MKFKSPQSRRHIARRKQRPTPADTGAATACTVPSPFEAYSQPNSSGRPPHHYPRNEQLRLQQCRTLRPDQARIFSPSTSHPSPFLTFTSIHSCLLLLMFGSALPLPLRRSNRWMKSCCCHFWSGGACDCVRAWLVGGLVRF